MIIARILSRYGHAVTVLDAESGAETTRVEQSRLAEVCNVFDGAHRAWVDRLALPSEHIVPDHEQAVTDMWFDEANKDDMTALNDIAADPAYTILDQAEVGDVWEIPSDWPR